MLTKIQIRRDTAVNWTVNNPVLLAGELALETNTGKMKIGDGINAWTSLPYFADSASSFTPSSVDSEWVIARINSSAPKVQADSDWITRNFKERADSDWVIRTIKRLDVDSDWVTKQLYTKAQSDSDLLRKTQVTNTFYVNNGGNTFAEAISKVGTSKGRQIILHPASTGTGAGITINNADILTINGPTASSGSPAVEILGKVTLTGAASTRVRFAHVQFDSEFELNGTQGRHTFKGVVFEKAMRITGSTTNFLTFEDCTFDGGFIVSNTFAGVIYLVRCGFNNIAPTLGQVSPLQVIMGDCSGLPAFPTNASLFGNNSLATTGFTRWTGNELHIGGKTFNGNLDSDWALRSSGWSTSNTQTKQMVFGDFQTAEKFATLTNPSGIITINNTHGNLWRVNGTSSAWAANITNISDVAGVATAITFVMTQSTPVNLPSVRIEGTVVTVRWLNGTTPTVNANKTDILNLTILRIATTGTVANDYVVTGSLTSFG